MFKKITALIICGSMLVLCGCTQNNSNQKTTTNITTGNTSGQTTVEKSTESTTTPSAKGMTELQNLSTSKVVWGPGNIVNHQQPADPVSLQKEFASADGKWLLDDKKSICLTFDEGYENGYTPQILDVLKAKKVKAIFFVTYDFAKDKKNMYIRQEATKAFF